MEVMTKLLENQIKEVMQSLAWIQPEVADLIKLYWSGDVSSDISALAGTDPATKSSKLTKDELINGLTLSEQLDKFFTNQAVAQSDYHGVLQDIIYGNDEIITALSVATEAFGDRVKSLAEALRTLFSRCKDLLDLYNDAEISAAVAGISDGTIVFGAEVSKSELISGITLCDQFKKFINNEIVTTGDYGSTVAKWRRIG